MVLFPLASSYVGTDSTTILLRTASCVLAAATAPLAVELLALTAGSLLPERGRKKRIHPVAPVTPLPLSVVIPARDEQALLGRCVNSLLADLPSGSSVLVVAHNCKDHTAQVAAYSGAEVLVLNDDGRQGKGAALRAGFAHAVAHGAHVLAVVDADSVVVPGFSAAVANALIDGAEAFQARYVFGFRSSVLERVPYEASSLVEDLEYHLRLVDAGICVEFLQDATVWSEMPQSSAAASSQRARWEGGRLRMARVWLPHLLRRVLGGRPSLLEPALELASLPLASEVVLLGVCLLLPVPWLRIYALAAFAVILTHVAAAAAEGNGWWSALRTLLSVPRYILWKLKMLPRTLASSRRNAAWVRTSREVTPPQGPAVVTPIDRKQRSGKNISARDLIVAGSGKGRR
jgi:cellulose synthase/poly-beta-1,6-N-acetylglucosamine synthase-like glycosyltransferase